MNAPNAVAVWTPEIRVATKTHDFNFEKLLKKQGSTFQVLFQEMYEDTILENHRVDWVQFQEINTDSLLSSQIFI